MTHKEKRYLALAWATYTSTCILVLLHIAPLVALTMLTASAGCLYKASETSKFQRHVKAYMQARKVYKRWQKRADHNTEDCDVAGRWNSLSEDARILFVSTTALDKALTFTSELADLIVDDDVTIRKPAGENTRNEALLDKLAKDPAVSVRVIVAENPAAGPVAMGILAQDPYSDVHVPVLTRQDCPQSVLEDVVYPNDSNRKTGGQTTGDNMDGLILVESHKTVWRSSIQAVGSNPACSNALFEHLAVCYWPHANDVLVENPGVPDWLKAALALGDFASVSTAVIGHHLDEASTEVALGLLDDWQGQFLELIDTAWSVTQLNS